MGSTWIFRPVGIEFEYASAPNIIFAPISDGYVSLLEIVKSEFRGGEIQLKPWNRFSDALGTQFGLFIDENGRQWKAVPEIMTEGLFDGFELVSPPLTSIDDLKKFSILIEKIKKSGLFVMGKYSSTHYTSDISDLNIFANKDAQNVSGGDNVSRFVDLILFIENHIIEIYHMIRPQRYGTVMNEFAVPLSFNQRDLLYELADIPKSERTRNNIRNLFIKYQNHEFEISGRRSENRWKLRAFNYAKFLEVGDFNLALILEMRLSDLVDAERFLLLEQLFKALIEVGTQNEVSEFINPFGPIAENTSFADTSEFIKNNLNKSKYFELLKKLRLNHRDFPPFSSTEVSSPFDTSSKRCKSFLYNSSVN